MKETTRKRKKAILGFKETLGREWIIGQLYRIYESGKQGFDAMMLKLGKMMAETIMYIEREEIAGPDYMPFSPDMRKWASQGGTVFIGDQRIKKVQHPRLRGPQVSRGVRKCTRYGHEKCSTFEGRSS